MILLQLTSGQGPAECGAAVHLAFQEIEKEANEQALKLNVIEVVPSKDKNCPKSILIEIVSGSQGAKEFAQQWQGGMQWCCISPFRPKHKRKNWFFSGQVYEFNEASLEGEIEYQACRASGAGGQHVNTTDSAIRATHIVSGISVRVESERSQHANKRLAKALIFQKLEDDKRVKMSEQDKARWLHHQQLERGNPVRIFRGENFIPESK
ncbi:peptide chain release factor H [Neptunomonas sp.]|uniref:peptide chain release factor H n=1 Tax=Neptunomonas sp. TaxID=1971898 RepID=UPI0025D1E3A3|nr:peptide chain release factor H [Neptunomonas sp.]